MAVRMSGKDNRGSALVTVIIAVLFIGIIASIVISITHSTFMNILTGDASTSNFYEDEVKIDQFKAKLQNIADDAIKEAYDVWLTEYTRKSKGKTPEQLTDEFNLLFANLFQDKIDDFFDIVKNGTPLSSLSGEDTTKYRDLLDSDIRPVVDITDPKKIRITGVSVTREEDGHITTIETDIVLQIQTPEIQVGSQQSVNSTIADFALIADKTIVFNGSDAGNPISIKGNIYGGSPKTLNPKTSRNEYTDKSIGITAYNAYVKLNSDLIISRGTLQTQQNATVSVAGNMTDYSKIWVNNILMEKGTATKLDLKAICNVKDDLTIDGDKSDFSMQDGSEYRGYSTSSRSEDAEDSTSNSSIVVNGKNVQLDLTNLNKLWLFGKTYVSVGDFGDWGGASTYLQGESVSFRSLQPAYLLPGECITGIGHNPMTEEEYLNQFLAGGSTVNIDKVSSAGVNLKYYLNSTKPFFAGKVKYLDGNAFYYLYMNFKSPNMAAEYFQVYSRNLKDLVDSRLNMANDGSDHAQLKVYTGNAVKDEMNVWTLDEGSDLMSRKIINTGNILTYNGSEYVLYAKNASYADTFVETQSDKLTQEYQNLKETLSSSTPGSEDKEVTEALGVNFDEINAAAYKLNASGDRVEMTTDPSTGEPTFDPATVYRSYYVKAVTENDTVTPVNFTLGMTPRQAYMIAVGGTEGGAIKIDTTGRVYFGKTVGSGLGASFNQIGGYAAYDESGTSKDYFVKAGIIVVKGDVYLDSADFWGTIIASGNIYISNNGTDIRVAYDSVKSLIQQNMIVKPYFTDMISENPDQNPNGQVSIGFENWRKE